MAPRNKKMFYWSVLLFVLSLCFPILTDVWGRGKDDLGIFAFLFGWVLIFDLEFGGIIWLANLFILLSWIHFKEFKSLKFNILALFLALLFIPLNEIPNYGWCGSFLEPEACPDIKIASKELGYSLWLYSIGLLLLQNINRIYAVNWTYFEYLNND